MLGGRVPKCVTMMSAECITCHPRVTHSASALEHRRSALPRVLQLPHVTSDSQESSTRVLAAAGTQACVRVCVCACGRASVCVGGLWAGGCGVCVWVALEA